MTAENPTTDGTEVLNPKRPWLTRNLAVLSWVSLFQDTASELLYPILPIFLTTVLGAPTSVVGITEGLADGVASVTKVWSGRRADRHSRKGLVGIGYSLAAFAKMIIAVATVWPLVLVGRVTDRIGKGIRGAPRDALIADTTRPEHRGKAFGFHRSMDTAGAVFGPLIGLGLFELLHHHYRPLLIVATVPAVISALLVVFVRDVRAAPKPEPVAVAPGAPAGVPAPRVRMPIPFRRVVGVLTLFAFVNFPDALLILRAKHLGLGVAAVIGAYCVYNAVYSLLSYPAGALSDRIPRRFLMAIGLLVFAVAYGGLGLATSSVWVWVLFPIYGAYTACTDGVGKAWIVDLVPKEVRGRALGLYQGLGGAGSVVAGLWAGLAWGSGGRGPLLVSSVIALVLAIVIALGIGLGPMPDRARSA